jgi:nucleoid-associated protein YgaU
MRTIIIIILTVVLSAAAFAKEAGARVYKVWIWQENGDCLWNIAKKFYGDGHKWRKIYEANKDTIRDPRKIFPKQELKIPAKDETGTK